MEDFTNVRADMLSRIKSKQAVVGVIGLGYVGLPFCLATFRSGFKTIGFDIDPGKIELLNKGEVYLRHVASDAMSDMATSDLFDATDDFSRLADVDIIVICVPTPLTRHREPDLSYLEATARQISGHARPGQLIALESTTYPGTTQEVVAPIIEAAGLTLDVDVFLAFSPEREDPGNKSFTTVNIPKVVGADGAIARELADAFYSAVFDSVVMVSNSRTAEAVKLTENIFRSVNIALVNELKVIFEAMDIDVWEVIEAAKTKPFGYMAFYPGPGLGGHCIPIDPFYLAWKAKEFEMNTRFIELAGEINSAMPQRVVERLAQALDERFRTGLNGAKILISGIAYKKNVDDMRESPALRLIELLERRGAVTAYYDPFVPRIPKTREHASIAGRESLAWRDDLAAGYDAVLIVADHDDVDYAAFVTHAPMVVDTRNVCRRHGLDSAKIVPA